jgi:hypothetical protein
MYAAALRPVTRCEIEREDESAGPDYGASKISTMDKTITNVNAR